MTAAGVALGTAASFGLTRLLAARLYGVKSSDPLTFAAVPVILECGCTRGSRHSSATSKPPGPDCGSKMSVGLCSRQEGCDLLNCRASRKAAS
jgi:hypothetical protein